MMRNSDSLSSRDIERLSAYLDGDLPPKEAEKLEARLQHEAQLRRHLDELRETVVRLKELPSLKAPRNFTLSPAMAGIKPRRQPQFNFFRLASVVAAAALAIVVSLDILTASGGLHALEVFTGATSQDTTMLNDAGLRAAEVAGVESEVEESMAMQPTEDLGDEYFGEADAVGEAPAEGEGMGAGECVDCPTPLVDGAELGTPTLDFRHDLSTEATATAKWGEQEVNNEPEGQVDMPETALQPRPTSFWTPIRLVEIGMGTLLLVLVAMTLITRRRPL